MELQQAVKVLIEALRNDPSYYEGWKSNIAMSFKDEFSRSLPKDDDLPIHDIANKAADNFLQLLTKENNPEMQ